MRTFSFCAIIATLLIVLTQPLFGGVGDPLQPTPRDSDSLLFGRGTLILSFGLTGATSSSASVAISGGNVTSEASGFGGSIAYQKWFRNDLAATVQAGSSVVEAREAVGPASVQTQSAVTVPILFGIRYHPTQLRVGDSMFPFISGAVGPYLGIETRTNVGLHVGTTTTIEMAVGAHAAAGVDWYLGRHFNLAIGMGYHAISNYSESIGTTDNHSGPEFMMSFGWVF